MQMHKLTCPGNNTNNTSVAEAYDINGNVQEEDNPSIAFPTDPLLLGTTFLFAPGVKYPRSGTEYDVMVDKLAIERLAFF